MPRFLKIFNLSSKIDFVGIVVVDVAAVSPFFFPVPAASASTGKYILTHRTHSLKNKNHK